ncbi:MAG: DegT/DnrJ/EryC1/StrS family aminotransferase [Thermanaerothrix sp.]|nr:DegT/DnrJ/EryC1/StrS family aminotransferase [Thermanaerothrix sp.]
MPGFELFDQREIDAVADVLRRRIVHRYSFQGVRNDVYKVEEFEGACASKFGARHALGVSSGSAALYVALKACGIGPGDEVITTPFTFIASVEAILECGAVPVLGEIDESLNLDPACIEDLVTDHTRAVMPVHMFGASADMDAFKVVCEEYGLMLFEDACQAMGASYKGRYCGSMGLWGTFSLDPYKIVTVGEGGMVLTSDEELYHRMEYYHDHGHVHDKSIDRGAERKACLGFNFRMSEIQGALGLVGLEKLDAAIGMLRATRDKVLGEVKDLGLKTRQLPDPDGELATQIVFLLPDRDAARRFQAAAKAAGFGCGILSDNTWHYARHWDTLRDGKVYSRVRCPYDCPHAEYVPAYRPAEWPVTHSILERAAVFGLDIVMDDQRVEALIGAIRAGAKAV